MLARPAHAVLPDDSFEGGAGLERQHFAAGILAEEPQDEFRRECDMHSLGKHGFHPRRGPRCFSVRSGRQPVRPSGAIPLHEARGQGVGVGGGEDDPGGTCERKDGAG